MIICEICKKSLNRINVIHLRTHGVKNETEYKKMYPNADIFSKETKLKLSKSNTEAWKTNSYDNVFTEERNKKVANGKKKWWATQNKDILNTWLGEYRGSDKHIEMCKSNQIKATKASVGKKESKPEVAFELELKENNINYIKQFFVGTYPFDFYLPDENLLIEIDGTFYHPLNEEDCVYPMQKHNYIRDIKKTKVALDNGYKLKRIRV